VYDHDPEEVEDLGWEKFITRQWESIFIGYSRRWTGLRTMARRWSDLIEIGLGCSQDMADLLVQAQIINAPDRGLESARDAGAVVAGMIGVLADVRTELIELAGFDQFGQFGREDVTVLLDQHARLFGFLRASTA
jgi:hypothetical protein